MTDAEIAKLAEKLAEECWPDISRVRYATTACAIGCNDKTCRDIFLRTIILPHEKAGRVTMPNPSVIYYNPEWTKTQTQEQLGYAVEKAVIIYLTRLCGQYEEAFDDMTGPEILEVCKAKPIMQFSKEEIDARRQEISMRFTFVGKDE